MRTHPLPLPPHHLRMTGFIAATNVSVATAPLALGEPALDRARIVPLPGRLRLLVTDPAHNRPDSDTTEMLAASRLVATALSVDLPADEAVLSAHRRLRERFPDRAIGRRFGVPPVCVAVADWFDDGRLEAVRAGDCEVHAGRGADLQPLLAGEALTARGQAYYRTHCAPTQHSDRAAHLEAHLPLLTDASMHHTSPLGPTEIPTLQRATAERVEQVLVTTDGITGEVPVRLADLADTLDRLAARQPVDGHRHPHGDLAVVTGAR